MAVLSNADRHEIMADAIRKNGQEAGTPFGLSKPELLAAINAIDDWVNANAAAFNTAIPQPARGVLTAARKARLLAFVAMKRYEKGV